MTHRPSSGCRPDFEPDVCMTRSSWSLLHQPLLCTTPCSWSSSRPVLQSVVCMTQCSRLPSRPVLQQPRVCTTPFHWSRSPCDLQRVLCMTPNSAPPVLQQSEFCMTRCLSSSQQSVLLMTARYSCPSAGCQLSPSALQYAPHVLLMTRRS